VDVSSGLISGFAFPSPFGCCGACTGACRHRDIVVVTVAAAQQQFSEHFVAAEFASFACATTVINFLVVFFERIRC
jgi:hypothetical protein